MKFGKADLGLWTGTRLLILLMKMMRRERYRHLCLSLIRPLSTALKVVLPQWNGGIKGVEIDWSGGPGMEALS